MTSGTFPRYDSRPGVAWAGWMAEPGPVRALASGAGEAPDLAGRFDPLTHPVAITGSSVIGDQIWAPATWCAMAGCAAAFADPAALGEGDNRARAVNAGWAKDALSRLVCPACQRDRPAPPWWVPPFREAIPPVDHRAADGSSPPTGVTSQPARSMASGQQPAAVEVRQQRTWPRLFSALVSSRDGSTHRTGATTPDAGTTRGQPRTPAPRQGHAVHAAGSEERRVGKECRSRWSPYH